MKGVVVHAVLLGVALVAATVTWSSPGREGAETTVVVWDRGERDVVGALYRDGERTLEVERRGSGTDTWLWAREVQPVHLPADPAGAQQGDDEVAAAALRAELRSEEYPVGESGRALFERLARLRAVRDLGPVGAEAREGFGLDRSEPALTVRFADGSERTLVLGDNVPGGGARYAFDDSSERVWVLPSDVVTPFDAGVGALRLTDFHGFRAEEVGSVTVRAGATERAMQRRMVDSPPRMVWTEPGSERADAAFGTFMQQLGQLWIVRYDPALAEETLEPVVRLDYFDGRGRSLGFLEIARGRDAEDAPAYFLRTPATVVFGEVYAPQGERIEQELEGLFQGGTSPVS